MGKFTILEKPENPCNCLCHGPVVPGPCNFCVKHQCSVLTNVQGEKGE